MTEFKKGAKVRRVVKSDWPKDFGELGVSYTLTEKTHEFSQSWRTEEGIVASENYFWVVSDPIEEAKAVLAAAGYGITEPKKPETGVVVVYRDLDGGPHICRKEQYEDYTESFRTNHPIIASSRWTEGVING